MGLERARLEQANIVGLLVPRRESGAKIVSRNGASPASSSILYILDCYVHLQYTARLKRCLRLIFAKNLNKIYD